MAKKKVWKFRKTTLGVLKAAYGFISDKNRWTTGTRFRFGEEPARPRDLPPGRGQDLEFYRRIYEEGNVCAVGALELFGDDLPQCQKAKEALASAIAGYPTIDTADGVIWYTNDGSGRGHGHKAILRAFRKAIRARTR